MPEKTKKCAHPSCSCTVSHEEYCSPQCEAMEKVPDIDCKCAHPACQGRTTFVRSATGPS